jgi:riboflavin kinase/FMN adenylyltransferase
MNICNSFDEITYDPNTVITVGTFDGVHKGHQQIIKRLLEIAKTENLRPVLITFDPHPQIVLQKQGKDPIRLLTVISERVKLLEKFGINYTFIIPFSYEFSQTTPEDFISDFLYKKIGMKKILIGWDHMFGKDREGDKNLLLRLGNKLDFGVEKVEQFNENDITISSTKIRNTLKDKNLELANQMLGYNYIAEGYVSKGLGRGTKLGYPTANIAIPDKHKQMPANGVYLVSSKIGNQLYYGMANIGTRPTFTKDCNILLEVHFFHMDFDIYMSELTINFIKFIRDEKKFASPADLKIQLGQDKKKCKELIKSIL